MILILGGGLAGLSTALHLGEHPHLVLEGETSPGGLCRTREVSGFLFDYTGHLLHLRDERVHALVDELRAFSPLAQRTAKKLLNDTEDATLSTAIELEGHGYSRLRQSDDFREVVEAFHAKRPAKFKGT